MTRALPVILAPLLAALIGLTGCANTEITLLSPAIEQAARRFSRAEAAPVPAFAAADRAGAPVMIAALDKTPDRAAAFLRQSVSQDGVSTWITLDGSQMMFRDGLLVGTRGLTGDVLAADAGESAALIRALGTGVATRIMTVIDGEDQARRLAFRCQIAPNRADLVDLGQIQVQTRTVVEDCRGNGMDFVNYYWLDPRSREIIQSGQWAGPTNGKISMRKALR